MTSINEGAVSRILVATDGSVYSDVAVECGAWLASRLNARVEAIFVIDGRHLSGHFVKHVSEIMRAFPGEPLADRVHDYYLALGKQTLARATGICGRYGVKTDTHLKTGNVVKILADASVDNDLLMMGLRGENEEYETGFLGSVTEKVVRKVQRPVLLTHLLFKEFRRALLAYDGSEAAQRAMHMLARLAVEMGIEIDAVQLVGEGEESTALKDVLLYFKDLRVEISAHYLEGDSHAKIIEHAQQNECDLLAMGAFDNKLADRLALGTTTEYLMRNSPMPVLLHH